MTTIAYRDGILAADTQITCGSTVDGWAQKAFKIGSVLYATVGSAGPGEAFRNWLVGGMKGDAPNMKPTDEIEGDAFIFPGGDRVVWRYRNEWATHRAPFFAYGSGSAIALGAMAMGATAEQAVAAAALRDTATGGEITTVTA